MIKLTLGQLYVAAIVAVIFLLLLIASFSCNNCDPMVYEMPDGNKIVDFGPAGTLHLGPDDNVTRMGNETVFVQRYRID